MLGTGYRLARYRGISRLGRIISWHAMRGFMNSRNHDMTRNGERWLVERLAPALAGRSVIDVGANAGSWSDLVLQASPTSKVYTVEMIPTFVSNLRRRFGEKLTVIEAALSDRAEAVTGYRFGGGGRIPKGLGSGKEAEGFEMCTRTGDNLVRELGLNDVALIKIDVDGFDIRVLRGFSSVIQEQRPILQFEYSRFYVFSRCYLKDAYDVFTPLNYRIGRLMPTWIDFCEYSTDMETFSSNNYVACPAGNTSLFAS